MLNSICFMSRHVIWSSIRRRIESILMSLPTDVSWRYRYEDKLTAKEKEIYKYITSTRSGVNEKVGCLERNIIFPITRDP